MRMASTVAMAGYDLCPQVSIATIIEEMVRPACSCGGGCISA